MCARQNGQKNPRLKTTRTFFLLMKSERDTLLPLKSFSVKSGAWTFNSTLAIELASLL